ncbi:hypothetical protein K457DRAFT_16112 [Linnemannia elongata AG-77]|uniref:Uncharacterized protein n=1 Tax=Linnemannia elongata AG-77 TaxID=1314771 RepID=A0A197K7Z5_9FUNG|nr:hypothetical protein K457DRAFT_16112 [Linnemannia elongata AG-77]
MVHRLALILKRVCCSPTSSHPPFAKEHIRPDDSADDDIHDRVLSVSVSRMFSVVFGPTKRLRLLRNIPESKSYMLYMCAGSLHICEECLGLTLPSMTEPVLALLPMLSKGKAVIVAF